MENLNFLPIAVAALIPTIVGFIYYNPKVLGTAWMNSLGKTEDELKEGFNMALVTIVGLLMSFLLAFVVNIVIEEIHKTVNDAGELVMGSFHTFKHGAFHGLLLGLFIAMPIIVTNGMYERKSWKNIWINVGYWCITIALIGGLTDAWN